VIILRSCALLAAFAVTAIAVLPLRLAWAGAGASADLHVDSIRGTIWSGELSGVEWRGVALGDLVITSSVLDRPGDLVLKAGSETGPLTSATVPLSSRGQVVDDISASVELATIMAGAPAGARLSLDEGSIALQGDRCISASGSIATDPAPAHGLPAFAGQLGCRDGLLSTTLSSADGLHQLTVSMGLGVEARLVVTEASAATQLWLATAGIPMMAPEGGL
jgi:Type II secretion system (T2SS), protein N